VGFTSLVYAAATTVGLMVALFLLSQAVLRYGLMPLSAALSLSGFNRPLFYLFILPGTVVHEASHLIACLLTGVRVRSFQLFAPQQNGVVGWVNHDRADIVRRNLIALAPFLGGSLMLYLLTRLAFPGVELSPESWATTPGDVGGTLGTLLSSVGEALRGIDLGNPVTWLFLYLAFSLGYGSVGEALRGIDLGNPVTWLFLYLAFSLGYGIAPSRHDLSPSLLDGAIVLGAVLLLRLADSALGLGLGESDVANSLAGGLAGLLQGLNALLLFSAVLVAAGAVFLIPLAAIIYRLRGG